MSGQSQHWFWYDATLGDWSNQDGPFNLSGIADEKEKRGLLGYLEGLI
jgi:hypothetical protein